MRACGRRARKLAPVDDSQAAKLLEQLRQTTDREEKVRLLKELVQSENYLTEEMLEVAFARLLARLLGAE